MSHSITAPVRLAFSGDKTAVCLYAHDPDPEGDHIAISSVELNRAEVKALIAALSAMIENDDSEQFEIFCSGAEVVKWSYE